MSSWSKEKREEYQAKLRDPRWQKMRLEVLNRDEWRCKICGDATSTLHVHHRWYERGGEPWDVPLECLVTLCETCHEQETSARASDERDLLAELKKRYFGFELAQISKLLANMPHRNVTEVQLTAVTWALSHDNVVDEIIRAYFDRECPHPSKDPPQAVTFEHSIPLTEIYPQDQSP